MHKQSLHLVFSDKRFIVLSVGIFIGMLMPLSIFSGYIFLEPYFVFYVPDSIMFNFALLVIISALTGLVSSMGIYRIRILRIKSRKAHSGVYGSILGAGAGACGCLSMNTTFLSVFGVLGSTFAIFSSTYEIPLRLASIVILGITYVAMAKGISADCEIQINEESN